MTADEWLAGGNNPVPTYPVDPSKRPSKAFAPSGSTVSTSSAQSAQSTPSSDLDSSEKVASKMASMSVASSRDNVEPTPVIFS
jgi:hypothetical protein